MPNPIKTAKAVKKAAERAKTNKIQKNSVKVKPAAKQKPNKPNQTKVYNKMNSSRYRITGGKEILSAGDATDMALGRVRDGRKVKIAQKKLDKARINKATTPKNEKDFIDWAYKIKINSSIPKRRGK